MSVECCTGSLTFNTYCCRQGFRLKLREKSPLHSKHFPSEKLTSWLQELGLNAKDGALLSKNNFSHGFLQMNNGIFTLKIPSSDKLQTWDSLSTTEVAIKVMLSHWLHLPHISYHEWLIVYMNGWCMNVILVELAVPSHSYFEVFSSL